MSTADEQLPESPAPVIAYETPMHYQSAAEQSIWRVGADLIVRKDLVLPGICIKCGAPAEHRHTKTLTWIHPAWLLLILLSWIILLIVYLVVRKTGRVGFALCEAHEQRRRRWVMITWLTSLAGLGSLFVGIYFLTGRRTTELGAIFMIGFVVLLILALVFGLAFARVLYAKKIDDHFIWLRGVTADFAPYSGTTPATATPAGFQGSASNFADGP